MSGRPDVGSDEASEDEDFCDARFQGDDDDVTDDEDLPPSRGGVETV